MADRWSIRPAILADVPAIAAAEIRCFSDPWSEEGIASLFENGSLIGRVAGEGPSACLAGYLLARSIAGEAEIMTLAVLPEYRRQGLGGAVLDDALGALRTALVGTVYLEVRESNLGAGRLYAGRGFRPVGVRSDYYRNPRENALVLRLDLAPERK